MKRLESQLIQRLPTEEQIPEVKSKRVSHAVHRQRVLREQFLLYNNMEVIMEHNEKFIADVKSAWAEVFPNSRCIVRNIMGSLCFNGYLSKDNSEVANSILLNDPLSYSGWYSLDNNDVFKEEAASLSIAPPAGSYLAFVSASLRRKSIKQPDREKLVKRFVELRELVRSNKDNMIQLHFNINEKV